MTRADRTRQTSPSMGDTLTPAQAVAVELIAQGKGDTEAAEAAKVTRQTVNEWRHHNPAFIASVNMARRELWSGPRERLQGLAGKAVGVLERMLDLPVVTALPAAVAVLKAVKELPPPAGPETPEGALRSIAERRVAQEAEAKPVTEVDRLLEAVGDDHPRRVAAMMERLRAEAGA